MAPITVAQSYWRYQPGSLLPGRSDGRFGPALQRHLVVMVQSVFLNAVAITATCLHDQEMVYWHVFQGPGDQAEV